MPVVARGGRGWAQTVSFEGGNEQVIDEPEHHGGSDEGPSAVQSLAGALAACTASTMRMYADRKGWDLTGLEVAVDTELDGPRPVSFRVDLHLPDGLDEQQADRLRVIAAKCPVHRAISESTPVEVS